MSDAIVGCQMIQINWMIVKTLGKAQQPVYWKCQQDSFEMGCALPICINIIVPKVLKRPVIDRVQPKLAIVEWHSRDGHS